MPPQVPPINHLVWRHPIVLLMSSAADLHARLSTSSSGITNDSPLPHGDELSHITSSHDSLTSAAVPAPSSAPPAPPLPPSTPPPNPSLSDTTAELSDRLRHRLQQLAERRSSGRQQLRKVIFTPFTFDRSLVAFIVWGNTFTVRDVLAGRAPDLLDVPRARFWRSHDILHLFRANNLLTAHSTPPNISRIAVTGWFHFLGGTIPDTDPLQIQHVFDTLVAFIRTRLPVDVQANAELDDHELSSLSFLWPVSNDTVEAPATA